jgi:hypothetical protein
MKPLRTTFRPIILVIAAALVLGAAGLGAARATVRVKSHSALQEEYLGALVQTNLGPRLSRFGDGWIHVRIQRYTDPDETSRFAEILDKKGPDGLRSFLGGPERQVGTVQIGGRLAQPIAAAWKTQTANGEHLVLVVPRDVSIREVFGNRMTTDYPYTIVELDVRPDGRGSGDLLATARLKPGKDGGLEYQDLRPLPIRILNVQPTKS